MNFVTKISAAVLSVAILGGGLAAYNQLAPNAQAQGVSAMAIVDQAKASGLVGEQIDGYLGVVRAGVSNDVQNAVREINIKRKSVYTRLASSQGVSPAVVAALSGEKLVAKAPAGQMVRLSNGSWTRV